MTTKKQYVLGGVVTLTLAITVLLSGISAVHSGEIYNYQTKKFQEIESQRGLPVRGMSSEKVRSNYGEPISQKGPVGSPPISVWIYGEFNVYFEHNLVITTVSKQDFLPTELNQIQ